MVKKPKKAVKKKVSRKTAAAGDSWKTVYLALGSNLGDREENIQQAIFLLEKTPGIKLEKVSSVYETEPEGDTDQPMFLNAAAEIRTNLTPQKLMSEIVNLENVLGREREVQWGPRPIDVDILLYEDQIISNDDFQVPHPLMHERLFVMTPLTEIAPETIHPAFGLTIAELHDELTRQLGDQHDVELKGGFKRLKEDFKGFLKESTFE